MTTVVLNQLEETFELFSICLGRSVDDCIDFIWVGSKTIAAEKVSEVLDRRYNEDTFFAFVLYSSLT